METERLAVVTHALRGLPSRRDILRGLAGVGLVFTVARGVDAGKKGHRQGHKHKGKRRSPSSSRATPPVSPPPFNAFGCLDVGQQCQGQSTVCCSGICDARTSTCVAHGSGTCFADTDTCTAGVGVVCNGSNSACLCTLTTGNGAFCADFSQIDTTAPGDFCRLCSQDTDCQEEFGPEAACVVLKGICTPLCASTDRTACLRPCA